MIFKFIYVHVSVTVTYFCLQVVRTFLSLKIKEVMTEEDKNDTKKNRHQNFRNMSRKEKRVFKFLWWRQTLRTTQSVQNDFVLFFILTKSIFLSQRHKDMAHLTKELENASVEKDKGRLRRVVSIKFAG